MSLIVGHGQRAALPRRNGEQVIRVRTRLFLLPKAVDRARPVALRDVPGVAAVVDGDRRHRDGHRVLRGYRC